LTAKLYTGRKSLITVVNIVFELAPEKIVIERNFPFLPVSASSLKQFFYDGNLTLLREKGSAHANSPFEVALRSIGLMNDNLLKVKPSQKKAFFKIDLIN
jgi:hypothetical protein